MTKQSADQVSLQRRPWDLGQTFFWSLIIGGVFIAIQFGLVKLYLSLRIDSIGTEEISSQLNSIQSNSTLISIMTLVTTAICGSMIYLLVRNREISIRNYLALKPVKIKHLAGWIAALLTFSFLSNLVAVYFQQDVVTDFARDLYNNADSIILLAIAVVIAGPFFEEIFFRGFMYFGISRSRLGVVGAILITAIIWTLIHAQYDWYVRGNIFVIGILFGYARYKSGSILPPLAMHMLMNAVALIEVANL